MGGGASSNSDDVLHTSLMMGRAFAAISFPDLYKVQDFHDDTEEPLAVRTGSSMFSAIFGEGSAFATFLTDLQQDHEDLMNRNDRGNDGSNDWEEGEDGESKTEDGRKERRRSSNTIQSPPIGTRAIENNANNKAESSAEESSDKKVAVPLKPGPTHNGKFAVVVGFDRVILASPHFQNKDGWTPLHACCHSFTTVDAALVLIEQIGKEGGDFNLGTTQGPGANASNWTPLLMASAYGLAAVVQALLTHTTVSIDPINSIGMTPLLECCARGYGDIARQLIAAGADVSHLPPSDMFRGTPFVRPHAQRPLGESARCGFPDICKALLESGCGVDDVNEKKWTALHEACYTNHFQCVKLLITEGADATVRTDSGALPYQLAVTGIIKSYIRDYGGNGSVPDVDEPLSSILFGADMCNTPFAFGFQWDDEDDEDEDEDYVQVGEGGESDAEEGAELMPERRSVRLKKKLIEEVDSTDVGEDGEYLNKGGLLGDLPSLKSPSPEKKEKREKKKKKEKKRKSPKKDKQQRDDIKIDDVPEKFKCRLVRAHTLCEDITKCAALAAQSIYT